MGPLPSSGDFRYLLTIIDRTTRWPDAIPLKEATAASCASGLLTWIGAHGIPEEITTDRGSTFTSSLWTELAESLGTSIHHTTAYNPEANGVVERLHRSLKAALMARCTGPSWHTQLPWVLLGLRTAPHKALGASPAEAVYGKALTIPADVFKDLNAAEKPFEINKSVKRFLPGKRSFLANRKTFIPADLKTCDHVFLRSDAHRRPLTRPYTGPYEVLQRRNKTCQILLNGKPDWVSLDRVKPAHLPPAEEPDPPSTRSSTLRT